MLSQAQWEGLRAGHAHRLPRGLGESRDLQLNPRHPVGTAVELGGVAASAVALRSWLPGGDQSHPYLRQPGVHVPTFHPGLPRQLSCQERPLTHQIPESGHREGARGRGS